MMRDLIFRPFALTNHNQTSFVKENDQIKRKLSYLLSKYIVWCKKKKAMNIVNIIKIGEYFWC